MRFQCQQRFHRIVCSIPDLVRLLRPVRPPWSLKILLFNSKNAPFPVLVQLVLANMVDKVPNGGREDGFLGIAHLLPV